MTPDQQSLLNDLLPRGLGHEGADRYFAFSAPRQPAVSQNVSIKFCTTSSFEMAELLFDMSAFALSKPSNENDRLAVLDRYDILDTPREPTFDRITRIVCSALAVPMAGVTLIDGHRQWMKSRQGPLDVEIPRCDSFCNVAIRQDSPLVVPDATSDIRFQTNPLVLAAPFVRFYAGAQLTTSDGATLGALCAIDSKPRQLTADQVGLLKDLAGMVMSEFEALRLSRTDSLTGVLTRGGFRDSGERMLSLAARYKEPLSCILLDVDHFKSINDTHGHAVGDLALIGVVAALRQRLRSTDIVGRIGGEEFAILLPRTASSEAVAVAEQIRQSVAANALTLPSGTVSATVSLGVSSADDPNCTLDELLHRADSVLYAAKQAGRNRTMAWRAQPKVEAMRRVLKAGKIVFDAGRRSVECTVKGMGQRGARVEVTDTSGIPDKFKLAIVDENFSRLCRVAGKQARSLEVIFA